MFAIQASHGEPVDLFVAGLFVAMATIAAVLIAVERLPLDQRLSRMASP